MPIRLTIQSKDSQFKPRVFMSENDTITIGRKKKDDSKVEGYLFLADERRMLSREHARIDLRDGAYELTDLSENGTWLNNELLQRGEPQKLRNNSEIRLGTYHLVFSYRDPELSDDKPRPGKNISHELAILLKSLDAIVANKTLDKNEVHNRFALEIKKKLAEQGKYEAIELFYALKLFARKNHPGWADLLQSCAADLTNGLDRQARDDLNELAYETLFSLRQKVLKDIISFNPKDLHNFGHSLEEVIDIFINGVTELIRARKQFEEELETNVTIVLKRDHNPIKNIKNPHDLAYYLFDAHRNGNKNRAIIDLENAIKALKMHQVASIAAFKKALEKGHHHLLSKMDPDYIRSEAKRDLAKIFWAFLPVYCWRQHRKIYDDEMDVGLNMWMNEVEKVFVDEYRELHKKKSDSETL